LGESVDNHKPSQEAPWCGIVRQKRKGAEPGVKKRAGGGENEGVRKAVK